MGKARFGRSPSVFVRRVALCAAFSVLALGVAPADAGGYLYRYLNADGHAEISNSIPPDRATLGYEVLDPYSMRVIEVVEAQKSPEEVARLEREQQARNACNAALKRVNRLYQSEQDVGIAKEQALESLANRIENAKISLTQARNQKRELEAEAARRERAGNALNSTLRNNIDKANQQIQTLEEEIDQRYREQDMAEEQYAAELELFIQGTCDDERAMQFLQAQAEGEQQRG